MYKRPMKVINENISALLLTSCIHPKYDWENPSFYDIREKQYEDALKYYIYNSKFTHIIFVDNSNYILKYIKNLKPQENNLYNINCKIIEYISFDWNKLTKKYQYGFWEQEIMDYALDNSIILKKLKDDESFFKITWRYIIKNINHLIDTSPKELFFRWICGFSCVTAIFKIKKWTFIKYLYWKIKKFYIKFSKWQFITLETAYYICLRKYLFETTKIRYPMFIFWYLNDWSIRHAIPKINKNYIIKTIYWFFYLLGMNQFWFLAKFIDSIFFTKWLKKRFSQNIYEFIA